jgi:monoamine oxidase
VPNGEITFYNYSFHTFVEEYMMPDPAVNPYQIVYNCPVSTVEAFGNKVHTTCRDSKTGKPLKIESKYVISTASFQVLRDEDIKFIPPLPSYIAGKDNEAVMWKGIKIFIRFTQNFYKGQAFCMFHCPINEGRDGELEDGESFYWDHGIPGYNVITGFLMGEAYKELEDLDDAGKIRYFLQHLDERFDGQASRYYQSHIIMDWTNERYVKGTYPSMALEGPHSVHGGQIMVAGEAFPPTYKSHGWVHGAIASGQVAADYVASHWDGLLLECGTHSKCRLNDDRYVREEKFENGIKYDPLSESSDDDEDTEDSG